MIIHDEGPPESPEAFFPVGDDIRDIFLEYVAHLNLNLNWGNADPLFPATRLVVRDGHFHRDGLDRLHWETTDPVRIFSEMRSLPPACHIILRTRFGAR